MSLPSKYSSDGLSKAQSSRTIVVEDSRKNKPTGYILRNLESKIDQHHKDDDDTEMMAVDDMDEVNAISDFVSHSRGGNDDMDVDLDPFGTNGPELTVDPSSVTFLVVDTNFILSHLNVVDELKKMAGEYNLQIVVPITVVMELDGLKNSTKATTNEPDRLSDKSVGRLARWANDWIYASLADNSQYVRGQKKNQKLDKNCVKDDAILDCCLYFAEAYKASLVVLMSNDKNLCLKALTNDILTVSYRKDMSSKLIAETVYKENATRHRAAANFSINLSDSLANVNLSDTQKNPNLANLRDLNFSDAARSIHHQVQQLMLSVTHKCMYSVYGDDLDLVRGYNKDSVVTLHDCAQVIIRFWFPVFQEIFRGGGSRAPMPFDENARRKTPKLTQIPHDLDELVEFHTLWSAVLHVLYEHKMDPAQNEALDILHQRWASLISTFK